MAKFNVGDSVIYIGSYTERQGKTGIIQEMFMFNGRNFYRVGGQLRHDYPQITGYSEDCLRLLFDFIND